MLVHSINRRTPWFFACDQERIHDADNVLGLRLAVARGGGTAQIRKHVLMRQNDARFIRGHRAVHRLEPGNEVVRGQPVEAGGRSGRHGNGSHRILNAGGSPGRPPSRVLAQAIRGHQQEVPDGVWPGENDPVGLECCLKDGPRREFSRRGGKGGQPESAEPDRGGLESLHSVGQLAALAAARQTNSPPPDNEFAAPCRRPEMMS